MDFIKYVGNLLFTAFLWNSNNPLFNFFGWFTATYTIIVFGIPRMKRHKNTIIKFAEKNRVALVASFVFVSLVVSAYTLQSNSIAPILSLTPTVSYIDDETNQVRTYVLEMDITNIGDSAVYQLLSRICYTPKGRMQNIYCYPDETEVNPLQPTEHLKIPFNISTHFMKATDGTKITDNETWYIYYLLKYSDSSKGGNWYPYERWYILNSQKFSPMILQEKQEFEPFVKAYYEKQNK